MFVRSEPTDSVGYDRTNGRSRSATLDDRFGLDAEVVLVRGGALPQRVGVESGVGEAVAGAATTAVAGVLGEELRASSAR